MIRESYVPDKFQTLNTKTADLDHNLTIFILLFVVGFSAIFLCLKTKAMRNCFFTLLHLTRNSGSLEFRMTEIYRKKTGIPDTQIYAELLNRSNGSVPLLRNFRY